MSSSSLGKSLPPPSSSGGGAGIAVGNSGGVLINRPVPRQAVSLLACSKLCGICFVAGIIVGYTLKRRVRRWASKILRRIRDD